MAGSTPEARSSASSKREIDSTPATRFAQNSSTSRAPGNRPTIPMIATLSTPSWSAISATLPPLSQLTEAEELLTLFLDALAQIHARITFGGRSIQARRQRAYGRAFEQRRDRDVLLVQLAQ